MRRYISYLFLTLLCCAVWCVLMQDFHPLTIALGSGCGAAVVFITHRFVFARDNAIDPLPLWRIAWYPAYLAASIFRAGFRLIPAVLRGRCSIGVYRIRTRVQGDLRLALLANSITLTPGTVTVDLRGDTLTVLCLDTGIRDPDEAARLISGGFERILTPGRDGS